MALAGNINDCIRNSSRGSCTACNAFSCHPLRVNHGIYPAIGLLATSLLFSYTSSPVSRPPNATCYVLLYFNSHAYPLLVVLPPTTGMFSPPCSSDGIRYSICCWLFASTLPYIFCCCVSYKTLCATRYQLISACVLPSVLANPDQRLPRLKFHHTPFPHSFAG